MSKQIPEIEESSKFNFITSIWIVPFIALIIAGWLGYQHFAKRGPEIKIVFPKNEGLVAGQSLVKFRNVPVGKVTKIYADEETDGVTVVVRMNTRKSKPYLTEHARFWIVKPEVGLSGVSGLDTLISGTYMNVYSKAGGKRFKEKFIGLTQPYRDSVEGEYFHLASLNGENVSVGTPIYYKNIKVGQVEYVYLALDNKSIDIIIFIDKQYVPFVHDDSKFWTKNMMNIDFTKGNLDINIAPLNFMLQGGIIFSSSGEDKNISVAEGHVFPLYESKTQAESTTIGSVTKAIKKFMLLTDDSIANLRVNAPVRFDGFDIGRVSDMELSYDKSTHKMLGQVLVDIDTSVFEDKHESNSSGELNFYQAVEEGLRAKLVALDPITGMLFIDLTFNHQDGNGSIVKGSKYARLPMTRDSSRGIMTSMTQILDKLNNLPLEKLLASVNKVVDDTAVPIANANEVLIDLKKTIENINALTSKKSFEVLPDELNKAITSITRTLKSTEKVVKGYERDPIEKRQLMETLNVLTKTSQEMKIFLRMLNRKPNSLIFGDN
ncbi:intermembrane transport protein PqiB [Sulfurovum sp. CS9]|uniref:PqiB family protein n=1 Tax=Sulfurovum sp. CS9 TaxID=3391146 RepID=UPI0039EA3ED6